jgi:hemolysin III
VAANAREDYFADAGSFGDFFVNCRDIHAAHVGPASRLLGATIFALVWALAIFGVILKATRGTSRHPKLGMTLYLGTGWLALIAVRPITLAIPFPALFWLVAGGVAYTTGVLFFVNERLRYSHFIWHLFVLFGSSCHFLAILSCCAT